MKSMIRYRLAQFFSPSPSLGPPLSLRLAASHPAKLHSLLALAPVLFLAHTASAQTWQTVDDFQYSPGTNAYATGLAKDPTGTIIYTGGDAQDASGVFHALAFKSSDGGASWSLMDDFVDPTSPPGDGVGYDAGIAADSSGNIYGSGYEGGGSTLKQFTRRSLDGGTTWSTVDTVAHGSPRALAIDSARNVYVVGATITNGWVVRKGTNNVATGGMGWANVDQFVTQGVNAIAIGVFCHPTHGVFVVGQEPWTVRRSQDGGATWTTVDTFRLYSTSGAAAYAVGADTNGNVYVVGEAYNKYRGRDPGHWIVRKSADGGNSWSTVDDFQLAPPFYNASASAFGSDAKGNLFVAGVAQSSSGQHWVVRENRVGTTTWQTVDTFQYVSGKYQSPSAIIGNSIGNVFVAGYGNDAAGVQHWLVRKR